MFDMEVGFHIARLQAYPDVNLPVHENKVLSDMGWLLKSVDSGKAFFMFCEANHKIFAIMGGLP